MSEQTEILEPWDDPENPYREMCIECQKLTGGQCSGGDPIGCANDALEEYNAQQKAGVAPW
jgi:hypothetical protein